jgi:hypothetical protein
MNKNFIIFLVLVVVLVLAKVTYNKYCESKPEGCKKVKYEDNFLSDDHMDK